MSRTYHHYNESLFERCTGMPVTYTTHAATAVSNVYTPYEPRHDRATYEHLLRFAMRKWHRATTTEQSAMWFATVERCQRMLRLVRG